MSALLPTSCSCEASDCLRARGHLGASSSGSLSAHAECSRLFATRKCTSTRLASSSNSQSSKLRSVVCRVTKSERRKRQQELEEVEEDMGEEKNQGFLASGAALVNTLLFGAASRIERGTSVCVSCRGTGTIMCKECDASGVVKAKKSSGQSSGRMKSFGGQKSKEFIVSNRCRNCRGHGRLECPQCDGIGKRHIQQDLWS